MPTKAPVLLIHGGASGRLLRGRKRAEVSASLTRILNSAYPLLLEGASAVEAVTAAVAELENDTLYNAGRGSKLQSDGRIRMSASIMDGHRRRFAGCVNVESLKNPVYLARALLKRPDRVLSGRGAARFARQLGLPFSNPYTPEQRHRYELRRRGKTGTVGAVALDRDGRLAAATSTGGKGFEYPFRVSDSPTSAGNFANAVCAVSATGTGEQIVEFAAASTVCAWVEAGLPLRSAVRRLLRNAGRFKGEFGLIALGKDGDFTASTTTKAIVWAAATQKGFTIPEF
jgi:L-asparaginase